MDHIEIEDQVKQIYNKMGESYINKAKGNWENKDNVDTFLSYLNGKSILDIGCGTGELLSYCYNSGFKVSGVDISKEMLRISKDLVNSAQLYELSVYDIEQLKEKYDGIIVTYLLVHIPKDKINNVIKSINRLLNDDGIIFVLFTNTENTNELMVNYTLDEVTKLITDNNFEILDTKEYFETLYTGIVVAKKSKGFN